MDLPHSLALLDKQICAERGEQLIQNLFDDPANEFAKDENYSWATIINQGEGN